MTLSVSEKQTTRKFDAFNFFFCLILVFVETAVFTNATGLKVTAKEVLTHFLLTMLAKNILSGK